MKKFLALVAVASLLLFSPAAFAEVWLFSPVGSNVAIATPGTSSANVQLSVPTQNISSYTLRVVNGTNSLIFIKACPTNSCTAVASSDIPVLAGEDVGFTVAPSTTYVAAVTASGTATGSAYFQAGQGQ